MEIILKPHDPKWAEEFAIHKANLELILTGIPILSIEHVGSTSIPDLLAKPVIDIDIVIDPSNFFETYTALTNHKYKHIGECHIPGRHSFFQPDSDENGNPWRRGEKRRNTYVVYKDCPSLRNHRDVKRVLMEDVELRKEYAETKRMLVEDKGIDDLEEYAKGKNEIVNKILKKAGWTDEELLQAGKVDFY